ncbi:FAD-dependent oxidoreductase [Paracoccus sp. PS-1]|uniref:NAD(P)/FAD-dependent oxidoreductase n=1 Tax=unclassified Paracoccus (in: a-proteobacteria) TaxID=2688777 RepID=UPI00048B744D|nr:MULTISPECIES: FAD-dependent oxidoreductase [unclassified Paracoccus (in: a-proteobacteria)]MDQ7263082.1 FAD-dependent oxidoreductase [Paracoccus sp. PS1]
MQRIVIIGTGQGGQQMAASLRQEGFQGEILMLGEEPGLPYQRPPLSKAYMANGNAAALLLKPASFYERSAIVLRDGVRVAAIDRAAREVVTGDAARHPYDHLVIATGARNAPPPIPGLDAPGVVELRSLADAERIRRRLAATRHAVVVGGGFIGLEFAAMARAAGVAVTVVEAAPRLMSRALSPEMADWFLTLHREMGSQVLLDAPVAGVLAGADGRASGVVLADGREVSGDLVLMATGVRPNSELAEAAGLACANGILVDATLATADPAISALGDVAAFPGPLGRPLRLESVQAAVDHARHIARRLVGGASAPYAAVPWFWSDQGKAKLQIAGLLTGADRTVVLPQPEAAPVVLLFRGGHLAAVETVNAAGIHMAARRMIGCPLAQLEAHGFDLRAAMKAAA